jgi:hypothetical protein
MSKHIRTAAAVAIALTLSGCATRAEPEFGSSVRHMVQGQKYDPSAPRDEVAGFDGQKAVKAVEGYRADKKPGGKTTPVIPTVAMPTSQ